MTVRDAINARAGAEAVADVEQPTVEFDAIVAEDEIEEEPLASGSMLDGLRARARKLATENTVDLPIPGYNEVLVGRYRAVSIAGMMGDNTINPVLPSWQVAADILATACVGLYGRNAAGELEPLAYDTEVRYDDELIEMLDLQPETRTARGVVVAVMGGGELGQSRASAHFMAYQGWLLAGVDQASEVAESVVGEFPAR